jgi:hypothetical protein
MGSGKYEKKRCKTSYIKAAVVHIQAGQKKNINLQLLPQILQSFFALYRTAVAPFSYRSHLIGRPPRLIRYNSPISLTLLFLNLRLCSQKTANLMMCLLCKARQGACLFFLSLLTGGLVKRPCGAFWVMECGSFRSAMEWTILV